MGFKKFFRKIEKAVHKTSKYIPAVLGSVIGTALGGPLGGVAGGALGGASTRSDKNKFKGALAGAGIGTAYGAFAPVVHSALAGGAATGHGLLSSMTGINQPSLLSQLGVSAAPKVGGGLGFFGNLGEKGVIPKFSSAISSSVAKKAAAGQGLVNLKEIRKAMPFAGGMLPTIKEAISGRRPGGGPVSAPGGGEYLSVGHRGSGFGGSEFYPGQPISMEDLSDSEKQEVAKIINNPGTSALEKLMQLRQLFGDEAESYTGSELPEPDVSFKRGGHVRFKKRGGYIRGKSGGQADDVRTRLKEDDYVADATTLSLYGDGNSEAGAERLKSDLKPFEDRNNFVHRFQPSTPVRYIDAYVSPGELLIKKEVVTAIGNGNNKAGAKVLDNFRQNLREHKGVSKFLPPKSRSFSHYAFKGGAVR